MQKRVPWHLPQTTHQILTIAQLSAVSWFLHPGAHCASCVKYATSSWTVHNSIGYLASKILAQDGVNQFITYQAMIM